ncbi:hypothetical protein QN362_05950 [Actimicrobium sp. CCC2.4]|uniref:hypothetical protein n=1 Tax=Actimicrobium sp. CCC2.4 TaxID=3048606 RepID=UPI002AC99C86|nr:hypothetical protein [Actimicrobium sp. CCC2.4]MEB0134869.1 hypothetical protein [Actimicrobium sp. CCC2.4]WPX32077.1 hypothetical protein RHM62_17885 [Actimicrobium sp. CCC2.4]
MEEFSENDILDKLPLNETINFDGTSVCLEIFSEGAILSGVLSKPYTQSDLTTFLESSFSMVLSFDAGIAIDDRNELLLLIKWLPRVRSWRDAEIDFEKLLNQMDCCIPSTAVENNFSSSENSKSREEQRIRRLLYR